MSRPAPSTMSIYLASNSPRRRELLHQIHVRHEALLFRGPGREDHDINEDVRPGEDAFTYVQRVAQAKAEGGIQRMHWRGLPPQLLLAADTTLELDGEIIGKPRDAADAHAILTRLSGRQHRVLTAVAMSDGERTRSRVSVSEVRFRTLSEHDIRRYIATGEPMDKAGAYGIQGHAAIFIDEIRGSYSGIMGLPLFDTAALLEVFGDPL